MLLILRKVATMYGGWFATLRVALSIATTQPISLSPFGLVACDITTKHQTVRCRAVVLLSCLLRVTPNGALSCGVLSRCHIVALFKLKDWLISQRQGDIGPHDNAQFGVPNRDRTAIRQRAVWRFVVLSLATWQQDESRTMRHLVLCRVVASAN
jgi:hypothetical protein